MVRHRWMVEGFYWVGKALLSWPLPERFGILNFYINLGVVIWVAVMLF